MATLPRFRPNRVRPDEAPELVASRNFDALSSVMGKAFGAIEGDSSAMAKTLARKANATNPVIRGLLTLLGGVADLSQLSVTGNTTLTSANGTVLADATSGSLTINLPPAATSKGLQYQIYKVDASANTVTVDANASETIGGALTIVLGGNVGNSRLLIFCDGANWQIRELYEEGTFTVTAVGLTTAPTGTTAFVRNGKQVLITLPDISGTSNSNGFSFTGLPSFLQFSSGSTKIMPIANAVDNGVAITQGLSAVLLVSSGSIQLNLGAAGSSGWTNVGTKRIANANCFTYSL